MKKSNLIRTGILCATTSLLQTIASAQSLEAHVHGEAHMAIVIDGQDVSVSLMSAMYNITGFEHAPETDAQSEVLQTAMSLLDDGTRLFEFNPAAKCTLTSSQDSLSVEGEDPNADESESEAAEESHHNHRDLEADYEFSCKKPSKLTSIKLHLFDHFENLQKVNVVTLSGGRQSAVELTPKQATLSLSNS